MCQFPYDLDHTGIPGTVRPPMDHMAQTPARREQWTRISPQHGRAAEASSSSQGGAGRTTPHTKACHSAPLIRRGAGPTGQPHGPWRYRESYHEETPLPRMPNESGWTRIPTHSPVQSAARAAPTTDWVRVPCRSRSPIGRRMTRSDSLAMASALKAHLLAQEALTDELLIRLQ